MLINATVADELRIAVVEDGELVDLDIEAAEAGTVKGNIYKGVVHNVEGSLEAAFINFGHHKQGFLPFSEIAPSQYYRKWDGGQAPRITDVIKRGQDIVVQVAKDAVGEKGAALTTYLSLPGRFSVLMPGSEARGISRKIEDDAERKKIKAIADKIVVPDGCGYIIRTAGLGQEGATIQGDLDRLAALHQKIQRAASMARAPSLIHAEPDLIARTLRDLVNDDIDEVFIDQRDEYDSARGYFENLAPELLERVHLFQNPIPLFSYYRIEEQIDETMQRRVPLPSGGSIVIDQTEALVAIDVNSGKNTGERDHEDTVYLTNFEAAAVIARQLRLRDLGGIVVVDFIDMEEKRHIRALEKALKDETKSDRARIKTSRILSNGLCIITRQRIRPGIKKSFQRRCVVCQGTGWTRTPESHSLSLLKRIETRLAQGEVELVRVLTHKETAEHILNTKRTELLALEKEYRCRVVVLSRADLDRDVDHVEFLSKGDLLQEITDKLPSREERRTRGGKKRKKKKGEISSETRKAAAEAVLDVEASAGSGGGERERERGDKKRRRGKKDRDGERREKREKRPVEVPTEAAAGAPVEAAPEPVGPDGVTFTGRPSPEALERIKAEARARREARAQRTRSPSEVGARAPATSPVPADDEVGAEVGAGSAASPATVAVAEPPAPVSVAEPSAATAESAEAPAREGLLSRLFGRRGEGASNPEES
jgi:ribonuclease E